MLIYENGTLQHTDTCLDVIEHSGVKGMKWGRRKAKQIGGAIRTLARQEVNANIHPFLYQRAQAKHIADRGFVKATYDNIAHPIKTAERYNKFVKTNNADAKKKYGTHQGSLRKGGAPTGLKGGAKIYAKGLKNQIAHPLLYQRAQYNQMSKGLTAHAYANLVHPLRSTHEANKFVDKHVAAKKARRAAKRS